MKMKKIILIALVMKTILISINKVKIVHESIVGWKWKCAKLSHFHHLAYKYLCDNECAYLKKKMIFKYTFTYTFLSMLVRSFCFISTYFLYHVFCVPLEGIIFWKSAILRSVFIELLKVIENFLYFTVIYFYS